MLRIMNRAMKLVLAGVALLGAGGLIGHFALPSNSAVADVKPTPTVTVTATATAYPLGCPEALEAANKPMEHLRDDAANASRSGGDLEALNAWGAIVDACK